MRQSNFWTHAPDLRRNSTADMASFEIVGDLLNKEILILPLSLFFSMVKLFNLVTILLKG